MHDMFCAHITLDNGTKVSIEAVDMADLADTLGKLRTAAPSKPAKTPKETAAAAAEKAIQAAAAPSPAPTPAPAPAEAPAAAVTAEVPAIEFPAVEQRTKAAVAKAGREAVLKVLEEIGGKGVTRSSALKPEQWAAFMAKTESMVA